MGKKKRNKEIARNCLQRFNHKLSLSFPCGSSEVDAIKEQLESNNIPYSIGELPTMKDGKVIGCTKTITVTDSNALYEAINRISEISYEGEE